MTGAKSRQPTRPIVGTSSYVSPAASPAAIGGRRAMTGPWPVAIGP